MTKTNTFVGKYGLKKLRYLQSEKKSVYNRLLKENTLHEYLVEVQELAQEMESDLVKQMALKKGVTEELKAKDMMKWVSLMNNFRNCAEEIVCDQVIYN